MTLFWKGPMIYPHPIYKYGDWLWNEPQRHGKAKFFPPRFYHLLGRRNTLWYRHTITLSGSVIFFEMSHNMYASLILCSPCNQAAFEHIFPASSSCVVRLQVCAYTPPLAFLLLGLNNELYWTISSAFSVSNCLIVWYFHLQLLNVLFETFYLHNCDWGKKTIFRRKHSDLCPWFKTSTYKKYALYTLCMW